MYALIGTGGVWRCLSKGFSLACCDSHEEVVHREDKSPAGSESESGWGTRSGCGRPCEELSRNMLIDVVDCRERSCPPPDERVVDTVVSLFIPGNDCDDDCSHDK